MIDELLGPAGPGKLSTAVTVLRDAEGLVGHFLKIDKALKISLGKCAGVVGMIKTIGLDEDEIDEARRIVGDIEEDLRAAEKRLDHLESALPAMTRQIPALKRGVAGVCHLGRCPGLG